MAAGNGGAHKPIIPASKTVAEITFRSVSLGLFLAFIMAAANAYLGLKVGLTVSASIPAAVISMAILRGLLKQGTILENNIVQTIASTAESLAAGVIFTIPALLISGVWTDLPFWPTTLIAMCGGLLGVLFMIPLRKSHIVEDKNLTFPEGVACAQVLKTGQEGGSGAKYLALSVLVGAGLKFFVSAVPIIKGAVERTFAMGKSAIYFGTEVSGALLGVGYIIGFNIATLVFLGGTIGWLIAIPYFGFANGIEGDTLGWYWTIWKDKIKYMGVGAMALGGLWTIFTIREGIVEGVKEAFLGYGSAKKVEGNIPRTERNMKQKHIAALLGIGVVVIFFLYRYLTGAIPIAGVSTVAMVVMAFFFVSVSSYVVGLVGSSSNPVSGMTICAVLVTGGLLLLFGMTGTQGIIATLGVAGVVCCAACTAGDISQDLKTGYIVGATPKHQQWMEVVGATIPALIMVPVLVMLKDSYGIGTGAPGSLQAPQASLFASLAKAIFGQGSLPKDMVFTGVLVGAGIIALDLFQKARNSSFRFPIMAVAVGIYLPVLLSVPIFIGGVIHLVVSQSKGGNRDTDPGVLFASGLIAGEALMGVLIGAVKYFKPEILPKALFSSDVFSMAVFVALGAALYIVAKKRK